MFRTQIGKLRWSLTLLKNTKAHSTNVSANKGPEWLMSHFPAILKDSTSHVLQITNPETASHFSKALQYNISGGKRVRGLTITKTYEAFAGGMGRITEENEKLSGVLGVLMEMSQGWMCALDDIVDESDFRRGKPCWYRKENVGRGAITDCLLISKIQYYILKKYFGHLECYPRLFDTFNEGELITQCGQSTDFLSSKKSVWDFKMDLYKEIIANKTAYYSFNLPVSLGMTLAGVTNEPELETEIHSIIQEIGCVYQIQDDFLDCFGEPAAFGKVGNDIEERKCTWLAVVFMELCCDHERKELFAEIYGRPDAKKVQQVKNLYKEVGLVEAFKAFEEDSYKSIHERINLLPDHITRELLRGLIDNIHKREG